MEKEQLLKKLQKELFNTPHISYSATKSGYYLKKAIDNQILKAVEFLLEELIEEED